jgi:hypothetical protein
MQSENRCDVDRSSEFAGSSSVSTPYQYNILNLDSISPGMTKKDGPNRITHHLENHHGGRHIALLEKHARRTTTR